MTLINQGITKNLFNSGAFLESCLSYRKLDYIAVICAIFSVIGQFADSKIISVGLFYIQYGAAGMTVDEIIPVVVRVRWLGVICRPEYIKAIRETALRLPGNAGFVVSNIFHFG